MADVAKLIETDLGMEEERLRRNRDLDFKYVVMIVQGGIGKNIAATALVPAIKRKYPGTKLVCIVSHPDVWLYSQDVHRIYNFNNPLNVYEDYFDESLILSGEPYLTYTYTKKKGHLIEGFAELWGLDANDLKPSIFFIKREIEAAKKYLKKIGAVDDSENRAVMFQWFGGHMAPPQMCNCREEDYETRFSVGRVRGYKTSLRKETAQAIADKLKDKGFTVLTVEGRNFPRLEGHESIASPLRPIIAMLPHVRSFIGVDSFLQHASAIRRKKGLVLWGGTSPACLGYSHNVNYYMEPCCPTPFCHRPNSFFFDNRDGYVWNCIHDEACMDFDPDQVVDKFIKMLEEDK